MLESIDSPKNYFWKKQLCKKWFAHAIACTARADNNNINTRLFFLLSFNIFYIVYCWVLDALGRTGKLTTTRGTGIVYWRHQRAQWEWAPTRFWLWLGKYSNYVMKHYLMNSNIFCLGFPFLQLGRKKKHEKRCEIGKSVLPLHFLRVRISSSSCEKKKKWWYFFWFQKPQC